MIVYVFSIAGVSLQYWPWNRIQPEQGSSSRRSQAPMPKPVRCRGVAAGHLKGAGQGMQTILTSSRARWIAVLSHRFKKPLLIRQPSQSGAVGNIVEDGGGKGCGQVKDHSYPSPELGKVKSRIIDVCSVQKDGAGVSVPLIKSVRRLRLFKRWSYR